MAIITAKIEKESSRCQMLRHMAAYIACSLRAPTPSKAAAYMHLSSWNTPSPCGR